MKTLLLFIGFIISHFVSGQTETNDLKTWKFNGQVKECYTTSFNVINSDTSKIELKKGTKFLFNENGFISLIESHKNDTSKRSYTVIKFNLVGIPITHLHYKGQDTSYNNLLSIQEISRDEDNHTKRIKIMSNDSIINGIFQYDFNKQNLKTKWSIFDSDGRLQKYLEYIYDERNLEIEKREFNSADDLIKKWFSLYNENSDVIDLKEVNNLGQTLSKIKYEYEYDNNKNWIIKYIYIDGQLTTITKRVIVYYK